MKYIMFEKEIGKNLVQKFPFMFPNEFVHEDVAIVLQEHIGILKNAKVVNAGDYDSIYGNCSGESKTLKIKSDESDGDIILSIDYFHGIKDKVKE